MPYFRNHSRMLLESNIGQENSQGTITQILIQTANCGIGDIALEQRTPLRVKMWRIVGSQTSTYLSL